LSSHCVKSNSVAMANSMCDSFFISLVKDVE
jgi:hypothetical protein